MTIVLISLLSILCLLPLSSGILNGTVARSESVTYLASIRNKIDDTFNFGEGHRCGGSLITREVVLTDSICLTAGQTFNYIKPGTFRVVGGSTLRTEETVNHHVSDVSRIVHHEEANHFTGKHNLALVTMTTPVGDEKRFFRPIFLADKRPPVGSLCTIAGWGSEVDDPANYKYAKEARIGDVAVLARKNCSEFRPLLPEGAICMTWNQSAGACSGDNGGPLIFQGRLVGVLVGMKNCNIHEVPGFAVDVYQHLTWINENLYRPEEDGDASGAFMIVFWDILLILTAIIVTPEHLAETMLLLLDDYY